MSVQTALGRVNYLFDKSQTPHMRADELCQHFGLGSSTGAAKSKAIIELLKIGQMDPGWTYSGPQKSDSDLSYGSGHVKRVNAR